MSNIKEYSVHPEDRMIITLVGTKLDLMTGEAKRDHFLLGENERKIKQVQECADFDMKYIKVSNNDPEVVKKLFDSIIRESYLRVNPILGDEKGQFSEGCIELIPGKTQGEGRVKRGNECCVIA